MPTKNQRKRAKRLAKSEGLSYNQALNVIRPAQAQPAPYDRMWNELSSVAKQNRVRLVKQQNRVFLLQQEDYDFGYEYEEEEYDTASYTSFPDTEDGLELAISWLEGPYSREEEEQEA